MIPAKSNWCQENKMILIRLKNWVQGFRDVNGVEAKSLFEAQLPSNFMSQYSLPPQPTLPCPLLLIVSTTPFHTQFRLLSWEQIKSETTLQYESSCSYSSVAHVSPRSHFPWCCRPSHMPLRQAGALQELGSSRRDNVVLLSWYLLVARSFLIASMFLKISRFSRMTCALLLNFKTSERMSRIVNSMHSLKPTAPDAKSFPWCGVMNKVAVASEDHELGFLKRFCPELVPACLLDCLVTY